jgi:bifunctional DNase/RNase
MEKIQLVVLGLSASPASTNAYALILKEVDGERRLPIIIGGFEAQAIALEMEGVIPPRPMTHDLIRNLIDKFGANLSEVHINDLNDGTFYAKLIFDTLGIEVDARPSDAVAIAIRCNAPVFVNENILEETGIIPQEENPEAGKEKGFVEQQSEKPKSKVEQLQMQLDKAVNEENYERAAQIRDELKRILESQ